jgi:protein-tyrosine phosphatase
MNEIFWIKGNPSPPLALVLRPRGNDWLEDELQRMKRGGIQTLISLLEDDEAASLGLAEESSLTARLGMQFLSYPIPDVHVPPDMDSFRSFVEGLAGRLRAGTRIGVHCRGSIGRATITAACALIHLGWKPQAALDAIEKARGLAVPDTPEQEAWILRYQARQTGISPLPAP